MFQKDKEKVKFKNKNKNKATTEEDISKHEINYYRIKTNLKLLIVNPLQLKDQLCIFCEAVV